MKKQNTSWLSNQTWQEPPRNLLSIRFPILLKQFLHLFILRIRSADANTKRPQPPGSPDGYPEGLAAQMETPFHRLSSSRPSERATLGHPASPCEMRKSQSSNEEQRSGISWVPHIGVESLGDKLVVWVHGEIKGEERTESFEAVQSHVSA